MNAMTIDDPLAPTPQAAPRGISLGNTDGATPGTFTDPAPVAPAAPAPVAAPALAVPEPAPAPVVFERTGDPGLDTALRFFAEAGMAPESPEMQAAKAGDLLPLAAKLGTLGDKARGFEGYIALAKASFDRQAQVVAQQPGLVQ